jgi:hypothetical protein
MYRHSASLLFAAILVFGAGIDLSIAQAPDPKGAALICEALQKQVDHIVSIADSRGISDEEKVAKLKDMWSKSWEEIAKFAQGDQDMTGRIKHLRDLISVLLFETVDPAGVKKDVSNRAREALVQIKDRIKPYMAITRMICPQLVLPPAFSAE